MINVVRGIFKSVFVTAVETPSIGHTDDRTTINATVGGVRGWKHRIIESGELIPVIRLALTPSLHPTRWGSGQ